MVDNIILIGFMGSGKSSIGRRLSKDLGLHYVDTDAMIAEEAKMSIPELFAQYSEAFFRDLEHKTLMSLLGRNSLVVSTGGGIIKREENQALLKRLGTVLYLKATPEHIFQNIQHDESRPLLQQGDKLENIKSLMAQRKNLYETSADFEIEVTGKSIAEIAAAIQNLLTDQRGRGLV